MHSYDHHMDSHANPTLPVIEFSETNLVPGTIPWKSTSDSVRRALESHGCFVVAYDGISSELQDEAFALTADLFRLPVETKRRHASQIPGFGYGNFPVMPLFEYFGIEDGGTHKAAQEFTMLMWPEGHDKFCESIHSYCKMLSKLYRAVMGMVSSSYGLENIIHDHPLIQDSPYYMTRLMRYDGPGENERRIGIVPHRDKNFMSVIGTNEVKGLEIETRDGTWLDFEPSHGKFIVIVGEALMAWSNGRIYCPLHKVTARGTREKYSIGVFSFVRGVLQVPDELVDDENPLRFKPFDNLEFLEYCKDGGPTMKGAIQKYCGIN